MFQFPELSAVTTLIEEPPSSIVTGAPGNAVPESATDGLGVDVPVGGDVITGAGVVHPLTTEFPDGADPEYVPPH